MDELELKGMSFQHLPVLILEISKQEILAFMVDFIADGSHKPVSDILAIFTSHLDYLEAMRMIKSRIACENRQNDRHRFMWTMKSTMNTRTYRLKFWKN